ncbi:MAG: hypothetical protein MZU95_06925 [Desulfomicrobium escambiense]|nr:hypothetical protein [Desulfomicrobium escambiense]
MDDRRAGLDGRSGSPGPGASPSMRTGSSTCSMSRTPASGSMTARAPIFGASAGAGKDPARSAPRSPSSSRRGRRPWSSTTSASRRLVFFSLDGVFEKNVPLRGLTSDPVIDSRFDIYVEVTDIKGGRESLKKMAPDMTAVLAEIFDRPEDVSHDPFKARTRWVLDPWDRLIVGTATSYELDVFDPGGRLDRKVKRDYEPLKVTKADIDEFLKRGAPPGVNPTYDFSIAPRQLSELLRRRPGTSLCPDLGKDPGQRPGYPRYLRCRRPVFRPGRPARTRGPLSIRRSGSSEKANCTRSSPTTRAATS